MEQVLSGLGGRLEVFYFTFGESDAYVIADLPYNVSTVAVSLAAGASGTVQLKTTVLITPEEMDQAIKKTVDYRAPGQ